MEHASLAAEFVNNDERAHWHDRSLWFVRSKRDKCAQGLPEWELLRETASQIKLHLMSQLDRYLEEFERNAARLGAVVHWAADAAEHNQIVHDILLSHGVRKVVKSKSMLTEECHLNPFLERHGIEVIDTDLGERIVQLRDEGPSHIVMPAIHLKKEEIGDLFHEHLGTAAGATDPQYLAEAARQHLREKFLGADAGITGVNFAVAETGGIVVCTNEGNADLGVFLRLLARSATGQPITTYSSHFHGPRDGGELHIVLVDNGRTDLLGSDDFRRSLNCIRCGACMNTCPVYRRSGGHSYDATVPGPIGSILAPARDPERYHSLPFACSLCGSCTDVCPVKIDLHHQLLTWRKELAVRKVLPWRKRAAMKIAAGVLKRTWLYALAGRFGRTMLRWMPRFLIYHRGNPWGKQRELPPAPKRAFRQLYRQERKRRGQS